MMEVHVSNVTARTMVLQPHALLCEIQRASIEHFPTSEQVVEEDNDVFGQN